MNYKNMFVPMFRIFLFSYGLSIFAMIPSDKQRESILDMCSKGDVNGISNFVDRGVNINVIGDYGWTPLHIASAFGHENLVHYLVQHDADVNALDTNGLTPCRIAFDHGYRDIADYLTECEEMSLNAKEPTKPVRQIQTKKLSKKEKKQKSQQPANQVQPQKLSRKERKNQNQLVHNAQKNIIPTQENIVPVQMRQQQSVNQAMKPTEFFGIFKEQENQKLPLRDQYQDIGGQQNNVTRTDNEIHIYEYSNKPGYYTETILYRDCPNCPSPGVYYRTSNGLQRYSGTLISDNGVEMYNPLLNLEYTGTVWAKHDLLHNFTNVVEREAGLWARIVIHNAINDPNAITGSKKFYLHITISGQINEVNNSTGQAIITNQLSGVFEFEVRKNLYQQEGICFHRFLAPNGIVGAEGFGAKERVKAYNKNKKNY